MRGSKNRGDVLDKRINTIGEINTKHDVTQNGERQPSREIKDIEYLASSDRV